MKWKKIISLAFCMMLVLSTIVGAISHAVPDGTNEGIQSLDVLSEEIRNSQWFEKGMEDGIYNHPTVFNLIGKSYLGESIDTILLMSEEVKDFDLQKFLGSSVCSKYTLEDLKKFRDEGMETLLEVYEKEYLPKEEFTNNIRSFASRNTRGVPSLGASQWGTVTVTDNHMYENSKAPTLVQAFKNAGLTGGEWYISLFNIRLSGFSGDFAWLNGKTFNSIGNGDILNGNISSHVRCLTPKKAAPTASMQASVKASIDSLDPGANKIKISVESSEFGSGYQSIGGPLYLDYTFTGYLNLNKSSANSELTNGNAAYSLAGAEYQVYRDYGCTNWVGTLTTGENGWSNTIGVNAGTYYVKESKAPYGYGLDDSVHQIYVNAGQTENLYVTDIPQLDPVFIMLTKQDDENNTKLQGGEFTIKYYPFLSDNPTGTPKYTWIITTGSDGYARIPDNELPSITLPDGTQQHGLPVGTLTIQETKAPIGYIIDPTIHVRKITSIGDSTEVDSYNAPILSNKVKKGNIEIEKQNNRSETVTGGIARFKLTAAEDIMLAQNIAYRKGDFVATIDTNAATGRGKSIDLPYGKYLIEELTAPNGYLVDSTPRVVTLNSNTVKYVQKNSEPTGEISLIKRDAETGNRPQGDTSFIGAEYTLYASEDIYNAIRTVKHYNANQVIGKYIIKADGTSDTIKGLPMGKYYAKETKVPQGYLIDGNRYDITLAYANQLTPIITSNVTSREQIMKRPIALIKFVDYRIDDMENPFKEPEKDAEFKVWLKSAGSYDNAQETERDILTTDDRGYAQSKMLPYGLYRISQTKGRPDHSFVNDFDIRIDKNTTTPEIIIAENLGLSARLRIHKLDSETKKPVVIPGATFKIFDEAAGEYLTQTYFYPNTVTIDQFVTNEFGYVQLPQKIKTGWYQIHEVKAPSGYVLNTTPIRFYLGASEPGGLVPDSTGFIEIEVDNLPAKGKIKLEKTGMLYKGYEEQNIDGVGKVFIPKYEQGKLEGAVFEVIAAKDIVTGDGTVRAIKGEVVDTIITTAGEDYSKELYLGDYIVREKSVPSGYILDTNEYPVKLEYKDDLTDIVTAGLEINNKYLSGFVDVEKQAETITIKEDGEAINSAVEIKPGEGFLFALYTAEDIRDILQDSIVAYGYTNAEGKITLGGTLPHGKYYLKEIHTNEAYRPNDTKYPVDLTYKADTVEIRVNRGVLNELVRTKERIFKTDLSGEKGLKNALIEVTRVSDNTVVYKGYTDEEGYTPYIDFIPGKYTFKELETPENYAVNPNTFEFEISKDGKVTGETQIKNDVSRVEIFKTDEEGTPLQGVKFGLFKDGELVMEAITNEEGIAIFEQIPFGTYILKETQALEGYVISGEELEFTVDELWQNPEQVHFTNVKVEAPAVFKAPKTGDTNRVAILIVISAISMMGLSVGLYMRRKKA